MSISENKQIKNDDGNEKHYQLKDYLCFVRQLEVFFSLFI